MEPSIKSLQQALATAEARATLAEQARATEETARVAAEQARATEETARVAAEARAVAAEQTLVEERIHTDFLLADAVHTLIRENRYVDALALVSRLPRPHLYPRMLKILFNAQVEHGPARRYVLSKRPAKRHRGQRPHQQ